MTLIAKKARLTGQIVAKPARLSSVVLGAEPATGDATADQVLEGATFSNATENGITGTMPNIGQQNITPSAEDQTISEGYHDGSGVVSGAPIAEAKAALDAANEEASADLDAGIALVGDNYAAIKAEIAAKGVDMAGVKPSGYDTAIASIESQEQYPIDMTGIDVAAWFDPTKASTYTNLAGKITEIGSIGPAKKGYSARETAVPPDFASGAINGLDAMYVDGQVIGGGSLLFPNSSSLTVFVVLQPAATTPARSEYYFLTLGSALALAAGGSSAGNRYMMYTPTKFYSAKNPQAGRADLVSVIFANSDQRMYVNAGNLVAGTATTVLSDRVLVGRYDNNFYYTGYFGDVVICRGVLTQAQRETIEDYLMAKWGITSERP